MNEPIVRRTHNTSAHTRWNPASVAQNRTPALGQAADTGQACLTLPPGRPLQQAELWRAHHVQRRHCSASPGPSTWGQPRRLHARLARTPLHAPPQALLAHPKRKALRTQQPASVHHTSCIERPFSVRTHMCTFVHPLRRTWPTCVHSAAWQATGRRKSFLEVGSELETKTEQSGFTAVACSHLYCVRGMPIQSSPAPQLGSVPAICEARGCRAAAESFTPT